MNKTLLLLAVCLLAVEVFSSSCRVDTSEDSGSKLWFIATNTTVSVDIKKVQPPILTPPDASVYLTETSCLGYFGPLGPYGPLGLLGPLGDNSWSSASYWISGAFSWDDFSKYITGIGGPLSMNGPLGEKGAFTTNTVYNTIPCINDFGHQLISGGLWTALGPLSVLGPVGALGPLGPIGAHGFKANSKGQYIDSKGNVQRKVVVPFNTTYSRTFDLYERYTQNYANSVPITNQDTSFMVDGVWDSDNPEKNVFGFTSNENQVVTIQVVPLAQLDSFEIVVFDVHGNIIASTSSLTMISWIQLKVKAGESIEIFVNLFYSGHLLEKQFHLFVTGSTNEFLKTDITGPHFNSRPL